MKDPTPHRRYLSEEARQFLATLCVAGETETRAASAAEIYVFKSLLYRFRRRLLDYFAGTTPGTPDYDLEVAYLRSVIHPSITPQLVELMSFSDTGTRESRILRGRIRRPLTDIISPTSDDTADILSIANKDA